MGLSASMWTSVSGLLMHGEKMNVVGNNLANVSTVGFKAQRMDFQDFVYNNSFSASGVTQIGRGVTVAAVLGDFSQGAFETTNDATDLGISGKGFFQVKDPNSDQVWYTRAGDFRFNKEGYLNNPQGYHLQGWKIDNRDNPALATGTGTSNNVTSGIIRMGSPTDVKFDTWTVPPKRTSKVSISQTLLSNSGDSDKSAAAAYPGFSLWETWNGKANIDDPNTPPISGTGFGGSSSLKVYDEMGTAHTLTTYFDQVDPSEVIGMPDGYKVYEYMVTIPPSEDNRTYGGTYTPATGELTGAQSFKNTKKAGVMMTGQLIFDGSGNLINQTAYTYQGQADTDAPLGASPDDPEMWQPTKLSENGLPVFTPNFSGMPFANAVGQKNPTGAEKFNQKDASSYLIEMDFGIASKAATLTNTDMNMKNAIAAGTPPNPSKLNYASIAKIDPTQTKATETQTSVGNSDTTTSIQNGYASGNLNNYTVDQDGILYGIYSNGVNMPLYQLALYDFTCTEGLRREGGNLFSATMESGNPKVGVPGQAGLGTINAYSIEQSNVDMAREFVQMITTQRGFQGNSKGITTTDTMLETVINMKR